MDAFALRSICLRSKPQRSSHPLPILHMDASFDEASTSDADEREILEAANSDLYWSRVVSRHLNLRPPNVLSDQGDDM
jgi:hypothetical protein